MNDSPFYSEAELRAIGLRSLGERVSISRKASLYNPGAISVGDAVRIDDFCVLTGGAGISLGSYVHLGCYCALFGGAGIVMEDFSGLSARVLVYTESDDYTGHSLTNPTLPSRFRPRLHKARVVIGRHVIVGANSTLLPGVVLGEGAAVGAHSLVTKRCEEWWVYFGVPAKKLKRRSRELLALEKEFLGSE